jgi:hypothetical protein
MVPRKAVILGYAITRHAILAGETRPAADLLADPTQGNSGPGGRL